MILQIRQIIDNVLKYNTAGNAHQNTHKNSAIYRSIYYSLVEKSKHSIKKSLLF